MSSEAEQTTILVRSLHRAGAWARKYPDLQGLLAASRRFDKMRGMPSQPCDIEACYMGRGIHIEVKYMDGYKALNRKVFERKGARSQLDDLYAYKASGGISVVALVAWQARAFSRLHLWDVGELDQNLGDDGSIFAKRLRVCGHILEQSGTGRDRYWDIGLWLDSIIEGEGDNAYS